MRGIPRAAGDDGPVSKDAAIGAANGDIDARRTVGSNIHPAGPRLNHNRAIGANAAFEDNPAALANDNAFRLPGDNMIRLTDDNPINRPRRDMVRLSNDNMIGLMDNALLRRTHNDLVAIFNNNATLRDVGSDRDALRGQRRGFLLHVGLRNGPRGRRGNERLAMPIAVEVKPGETPPTPFKDHQ